MTYYIINLNYFTLLTLETSNRLFKVNDILYNQSFNYTNHTEKLTYIR